MGNSGDTVGKSQGAAKLGIDSINGGECEDDDDASLNTLSEESNHPYSARLRRRCSLSYPKNYPKSAINPIR
jgi:hypothetical protein